jgi:hypothetical protein
MSRQKAGQRHSIKVANRSFEDVAKFKYWATTLTYQNCIHKDYDLDIDLYPLHLGNACYQSVQGIVSSCLLSRNVKAKIYKTIILPVVLYGCETWSLILREEAGVV